MKILYVVDSFPVVTETFIVNQIAGMVAGGHEVTVLARHRNAQAGAHPLIARYQLLQRTLYLTDLPRSRWRRLLLFSYLLPRVWYRNPLRAPRLLLKLLQLRRAVAGNSLTLLGSLWLVAKMADHARTDVIHCQFGNVGPWAVYLRKSGFYQGAVVVSFRGHDATQRGILQRDFYRQLFAAGELFLPVSMALADKLRDLGCPQDKLQVLHSGIDCALYAYQQAKRPPTQGRATLLSVARFVEMKGLEYALAAVAQLVAAGYDVTYQLVGDGNLRPQLEKCIADLDLQRRVQLLGWKTPEEVIALLRECDLYICSSVTAGNGETEGIPNAVKEAMAVGVPVVATRHGGIPELVDHGESGFLVEERSAEQLARQVGVLLSDGELWQSIRGQARRKIEDEFDIEKLNVRLAALYAASVQRASAGGQAS